MRKIIAFSIIFAFVISFASPAFAEVPRAVNKIIDGTKDVLKSPLLIYTHTKSEMDSSDNKLFGFVKGLLESPFHVVEKAGGGVIDIVTFPIE